MGVKQEGVMGRLTLVNSALKPPWQKPCPWGALWSAGATL